MTHMLMFIITGCEFHILMASAMLVNYQSVSFEICKIKSQRF